MGEIIIRVLRSRKKLFKKFNRCKIKG